MTAGARWAAKRDIPTPGGWVDFEARPEAVHQVLDQRFRSGRFPLTVDRYTLPKPGGLRIVSCLDPFDEVALRVYVGRVVSVVERHRDPDRVLAHPLVGQPPSWRVGSHREPIARRKTIAMSLLADLGCIGLGTLDVENFYASVDPWLLQKTLVGLGCPEGAVKVIARSLTDLAQTGGPGGLPIGFEGSGLLSNAFLHPLDERLLGGPPFLRYADDVWVFPRRGDVWEDVVERFEFACSALLLRSNQQKARLYVKPFDDPWQVIVNRVVDSITDGRDERIGPDEAIEVLEFALEDDPVDWSTVRFALGNLASARSTSALRILQDRPELFEEEPVKVGDYLAAVAQDSSVRDGIDHDWLVGEALRSSGSRGLARQLHACRAASHLRTGQQHGQRLHTLAVSMEGQRRQQPLQSWAATAWAASAAWRPGQAIETAEHLGSLHVRRALCLPFAKHCQDHRKAPMWRQKLAKISPDLEPTLLYAFP